MEATKQNSAGQPAAGSFLSLSKPAPPPRKHPGPFAARLLVSSFVVDTAQPQGPQCSMQDSIFSQTCGEQRGKLKMLTSSSISSVFPLIAQTGLLRARLLSDFEAETILVPGVGVCSFQGGLLEPRDPSLARLSKGSLQTCVTGLIVWSLKAGWLRIYGLEDDSMHTHKSRVAKRMQTQRCRKSIG